MIFSKFVAFCCFVAVSVNAGFIEVEPHGLEAAARHGWEVVERARGVELVEFTVAVKQNELGKKDLEQYLLMVSDPNSPNFGKHLTSEEVHSIVKPDAKSLSLVKEWIKSVGAQNVQEITPNGDFMKATLPVFAVEKLLGGAEYHHFRHTESGRTAMRLTTSYSVPEHIKPHIDFISPTTRMPNAITPKASEIELNTLEVDASNGCLGVCPSKLRALYQLSDSDVHDSKADGNKVGIGSFLGQYYSKSDLSEFWKLYGVTTTTVTDVPSGQKHGFGTEAELDIQYATAMAEGIPAEHWSTDGQQPGDAANEPFLKWLNMVIADDTAPKVFSVSYGEDEKSVVYDYAVRLNTEFQKAGTMGISLLFASGDSGAGGNCTSSKGRLNPNFPAGSPWVTAVGGLVGGKGGATPTGETADSISGGGFSDYWAMPQYQKDMAGSYISGCLDGSIKGCPSKGTWNQTGAGYPDIAAQSEGFNVVTFGIPMPVAGTSCASPTMGGIVAMLNDKRLAAGKGPLGYLNPFLYDAAKKDPLAFNDAVSGKTMGCSEGGYPASEGWDSATGLGSINFARLSKLALDLP